MTMNPNQTSQAPGASQAVEGFINKAEVARRLGKKLRTVDNWMQRGILPYYKIGRSVSFKWSEIETALARTCRVSAYHPYGISV
jgi:excisionase family DNA binding protein